MKPLLQFLPSHSFSGSSFHSAAWTYRRSVLGSPTAWHTAHPIPAGPHYVTVDLLGPHKVSEIRVRGRKDTAEGELVRAYKIIVFNSTVDPKVTLKFTGPNAGGEGGTVFHQNHTTHIDDIVCNSAFEPFVARHVTIEVTSSSNPGYFSFQWELIGAPVGV